MKDHIEELKQIEWRYFRICCKCHIEDYICEDCIKSCQIILSYIEQKKVDMMTAIELLGIERKHFKGIKRLKFKDQNVYIIIPNPHGTLTLWETIYKECYEKCSTDTHV